MIKKIFVASAIIVITLFIVKKKDMTLKQSLLKMVYPLLMLKQKMFSDKNTIIENKNKIQPLLSFYELSFKTIDGNDFSFSKLKGKKVLLVNTASNCGYTPQYDELQELYKTYPHKLVILAFPANDFKEQEKADNKAIAQFCKINFGVTFPLMQKSVVRKNEQQNEVFRWLSDKQLNGWNNKQPAWNFSKYLVDENGVLTHYYAPTISPLSSEVVRNLQ